MDVIRDADSTVLSNLQRCHIVRIRQWLNDVMVNRAIRLTHKERLDIPLRMKVNLWRLVEQLSIGSLQLGLLTQRG